jgi:hypothetical protein
LQWAWTTWRTSRPIFFAASILPQADALTS